MIYILTGIAKSGKTLISKKILKQHQISVFSTDYIMMMLYRGNHELQLDINASDHTVSNQLEPYIYGMIKTMIENKETYFIEGVHFNTEFSKKLISEFKDDIKVIYLGYKDISVEEKVKELYKYKDSMNNPWLFNHQGQSVESIVAYMIEESKRIYDECQKEDLIYIDITDINLQLDEIISLFMKK